MLAQTPHHLELHYHGLSNTLNKCNSPRENTLLKVYMCPVRIQLQEGRLYDSISSAAAHFH